MSLLDRLRPLLDLPHRHRRVWHAPEDSRVHVELRELDGDDACDLAEALQATLATRPGVHWCEVTSGTGRVVIAYDPDVVDPAFLVAAVAQAEDDLGVERAPLGIDRPDFPGDGEPIAIDVAALAADAVGLWLALMGRALRIPTVPVEIDTAALLALLDGVPALRRPLERRLSTPIAELGLAVTNGIAAGLAQGPLGPLVDIVHRSSLLSEAEHRRRTWERREAELCAKPTGTPVGPLRPPERPVPLPKGPVEEYTERAWLASVGGFAVALPLLRSVDRAGAALLAGLPKAARLGREAFAAEVGRRMASRGVVILDPSALRRLDRVDVAVIDGDLLVTDRLELGSIDVLGDLQAVTARRRAQGLFRDDEPMAERREGNWALRPLSDLADRRFDRRAEVLADGRPVLALLHHDEVEALVELRQANAPQAAALIEAIRSAGLEAAIATDDPAAVAALRPDRVMPAGGELAEAVHARQRHGHGILVIGASTGALHLADCAFGVVRPDHPIPWTADLVGGDDLADAVLFVHAAGMARRVSRQSAGLALAGASASAFIAFGGLLPGTTQRVMTTVNVASLLAYVNGTRAGIALGTVRLPAKEGAVPWHGLATDDVLTLLESGAAGLSADEAARRRVLPPRPTPAGVALARAIGSELVNPLTPILAVGAGLSLAVGSVSDAVLVGGVVLLNAVIGGVQRFRTDQAISQLGVRERQRVTVLRGGSPVRIEADHLVPGDVIRLEAGESVPADCRILRSEALEVDESSLTGESLPVAKDAVPSHAAALADRTSMLYETSSIAAGTAEAAVVAVGEHTEAERSVLAAGERAAASGVEARLESITTVITPVSVLAGLGVIGSGLLRGQPLATVVGSGVSLAVAAVPEGLPLIATVAQHASARRLSERGALVRNVRAIEALGRVDMLCADKTGTLTEGHIRLRSVWDGTTEARVAGPGLPPSHRFVLAAGIRSTPEVRGPQKLPHPTDRAVRYAADDTGLEPGDGLEGWVQADELPFEPGRAFHAVLADTPRGRLLSVKGAPEVLIPRSVARRLPDGSEETLDDEGRTRLAEYVEELAHRGLRVLAVAERIVPESFHFVDGHEVVDLVFCGLLGLSDPVRPTAASAVATLRRAGVGVIMITGDHPSTAEGIAAELDLLDGDVVLTGPDIDELDDEQLAERLPGVTVCARVTPLHKVRIVRALQGSGRVVGMTGDGANDAPAIRLADVGIALGTRATTAARSAADLVVTDDRIETIVDAVVEGRAMWASVRDAVSVLVGGNVGEIAFTLTGSLLAGRSPLNARQLLLVNLLTDVAPAMAIAIRPPTHTSPEQLLEEGPDRSLGTALTRAIAVRAATTAVGAGAAWGVGRITGTPERASTVALVALVGTQLGQTLASGGTSPAVVAAGLGSFAVLAAIVQTPGVSQVFGCRPLGPLGWATGLGAAGAATAGSVLLPGLIDRLPPVHLGSWQLGDRSDTPAAELSD